MVDKMVPLIYQTRLVSCFVVRQMIKYSFREVLMVFTGDKLLHGLIVSFRLNVIVSVNEPEMVDVAALHMWNQKYGPQVSFDCNTQHVQSAGDFCSKHKPIFSPFLPVPPPFPHPHRIDRGGQQVFPLRLLLLCLVLVGAVLLHGLPAGEVDDPARDLLPLLLLLLLSLVQLPELHALKVLPQVWALDVGGHGDSQGWRTRRTRRTRPPL